VKKKKIFGPGGGSKEKGEDLTGGKGGWNLGGVMGVPALGHEEARRPKVARRGSEGVTKQICDRRA